MDLKDAIHLRRATREFTLEAVDQHTLQALIEAAVQAPSAVNARPWSFCVVRDHRKISRDAKAHMVRTTPVGLLSHHFDRILNDPTLRHFFTKRRS
jgi:nitroreductase